MYTFNICDKAVLGVKNIEHIHPRKQRQVAEIARRMKPYCNSIIIFGSSIRWDCHEKSDLDVAIIPDCKMINKNKLGKLVSECSDYNSDFLVIENIDEELNKYQKENIINRGVRIYAEGI